MIRVALMGAGRMGALHAGNIAASPRLELAAIVDPKQEAAERLIVNGSGTVAATAEQVLADSGIRGVVIASSTDAHLDDSLACLRAGKAVFCEKPLSLSAAALEEAAEVLSDPALPPLFVGFNRRFDPHFAALQARLSAGEIGRLESLHIVNHDPAAPALDFVPRSGGLFRDFTIHDFDLAAWLMGSPIVEIFAFASCLVDPAIAELGDVDTAKVVLRSADGTLCTISNSRRTGYGYDQRIEAFGAAGALRVDNMRTDAVSNWAERGASESAFPYGFADRYAEAYRRELDHFADLIEGKAAPMTGFVASLAAIRLADAAADSVATGAPVRLHEAEFEHA